MSSPIRVLVVDDSAFARKVLREALTADAEIEVVGIAHDGVDALEKIAELEPDVVTLDLMMPSLDGVGVLEALRARSHRPAVVIVSSADGDSEAGVAALAAGAFDVVRKPTALAVDRLYELSDPLRSKVLAAGAWHRSGASRPAPHATLSSVVARRTELVVICASTGGPQALSYVLRGFPATFPVPIALVLHMPEGYTEAFARRLDGECALDVLEARDGLAMRPGQVVVARAGLHLTLEKADQDDLEEGIRWAASLALVPTASIHRPSVDVLFESAAAHAGPGTLGVVLTGMGSDGTAGARAVRAAGGRVLTESESSCVVYGMPRSVVEAGLSNATAPLDEMPALIVKNL